MRSALMKARWLMLLVPLMAAACKDDPEPPGDEDTLAACIDQPTGLISPPSGQLPCELLPPGFSK